MDDAYISRFRKLTSTTKVPLPKLNPIPKVLCSVKAGFNFDTGDQFEGGSGRWFCNKLHLRYKDEQALSKRAKHN